MFFLLTFSPPYGKHIPGTSILHTVPAENDSCFAVFVWVSTKIYSLKRICFHFHEIFVTGWILNGPNEFTENENKNQSQRTQVYISLGICSSKCLKKCPTSVTSHYSDVIVGAIASQNHQHHDCLLKRLFRRRSMKTSKLRVTGLVGNSPVTGEFPIQMTSNAKNVFIWWRHHTFVRYGVSNHGCYTIWLAPFSGWQQRQSKHYNATLLTLHEGNQAVTVEFQMISNAESD